jgi:hypothetical protein
MVPQIESPEGFDVAAENYWLGKWVEASKRFWIWIDTVETEFLSDRLERLPIEQPVYIAGLARSGSTILLEFLASIPNVATHRYKDCPPLFVPFLWNWLLRRIPTRHIEPVPRTHQDGIFVTPESPEAMEEALWMAFFPQIHEPESCSVLDRNTSNPSFERFYRDHLRKLLLVRGGTRYVSKGNYNVTRLEYLHRLFPDAKFVIPIRRPATHIASSMKQHKLFCAGQRLSPRAVDHLRWVGHFEFGLDRRPINAGDQRATEDVIKLWTNNEEVRGWSRYWNSIYRYLADRLDLSPALRDAALVIRFEDLCQEPDQVLRRLLEHCHLEDAENLIQGFSQRIRFPAYYQHSFTAEELAIIKDETSETALRFGYEPID